jgi:N-sulfoglucosamine sulfohydrolase
MKQLVSFFFIVWSTVVLNSQTNQKAAKPNIIVIIADDHGYYHMSPYGNTGIPTPNLQKLADEGIKFNNAYVAAPYCVPSRHSLFTGLNPDRHGVEGNHEHNLVKPGLERIVERMYGQGYEIGMNGKVEHCKNYLLTQGKTEFSNLNEFFKNRDKSKPLLFFKGYTNTHTVWPEADPSIVDPAKVILPPKTPDNPATRLMHSRYVISVMNMDSQIGEFLKILNENLDMSNTLLIYTSDHGQNWLFGKWTLNDTGVRTPLIAVWPGNIKPNTTTDAMVSWVDLIPTFIDIAGGDAPENLDGHSFKKVLLRETDHFRDTVFTFLKGEKNATVHPARAVRTANWKYIYYPHPEFFYTSYMEGTGSKHNFQNWPEWETGALKNQESAQYWYDFRIKPQEELFMINEDPWEFNNLAYDPRYADTLVAMRNMVKERMVKVDDKVALSGTPIYIKDMQSKIPPAIKILYPNGGEYLKPGDKARVVWTAEWKGTSTVKLEYYDGAKWTTINKSIPHNGAFNWTIPSIKSSSVKLKISSIDGKVWDESNTNFTIASDVVSISKTHKNK